MYMECLGIWGCGVFAVLRTFCAGCFGSLRFGHKEILCPLFGRRSKSLKFLFS